MAVALEFVRSFVAADDEAAFLRERPATIASELPPVAAWLAHVAEVTFVQHGIRADANSA